MKIFGYDLGKKLKSFIPSAPNTGWISAIKESFSGAWQKSETISSSGVSSYFAVYSCITLIAADIGKLTPLLKKLSPDGIWEITSSSAFSPVLKRPNRYQNHIQFFTWWVTSKLSFGNTYVLKERDNRGVVVALYILDPSRVQVLLASDGSVYYQLSQDELNTIDSAITVPASEIIHDRMNCLFHPLVGVPPIYSSGLAAAQGLKIQQDSKSFFSNGARPGGLLVAPGAIGDATLEKLKTYWNENFSGENSGKVAVVGDGLKFEPMRATAVDSQLVELLKLSAEIVCSTYHVPPFKIGMGAIPAGQKIEDLNQIYYSDCVQTLVENIEICLDEGLALPDKYSTEMDLDGLLRMDTATLYNTLGSGIKNCVLKPNEARKRINLSPVEGGDALYLQQQNYSLAALAKRDSKEDPFSNSSSSNNSQGASNTSGAQETQDDSELTDQQIADQALMYSALLQKELSNAKYS